MVTMTTTANSNAQQASPQSSMATLSPHHVTASLSQLTHQAGVQPHVTG